MILPKPQKIQIVITLFTRSDIEKEGKCDRCMHTLRTRQCGVPAVSAAHLKQNSNIQQISAEKNITADDVKDLTAVLMMNSSLIALEQVSNRIAWSYTNNVQQF